MVRPRCWRQDLVHFLFNTLTNGRRGRFSLGRINSKYAICIDSRGHPISLNTIGQGEFLLKDTGTSAATFFDFLFGDNDNGGTVHFDVQFFRFEMLAIQTDEEFVVIVSHFGVG